jgi:tRNA(Ile2) C34 agmatinyltransferase TiaS
MVSICPCCGGDMVEDTDLGQSIIYKCADCGLSDSRLKDSKVSKMN